MSGRSIDRITSYIREFKQTERARFHRIYRVWSMESTCICPEEMTELACTHFGSVEAVQSQTVIRIQNIQTNEGALFNPLRSSRPKVLSDRNILDLVLPKFERLRRCPLCRPYELMPADSFPPHIIEGTHCVTTSNAAKYDGMHGLIVFNEHDPLDFSREKLSDYIEVAQKWFDTVNNKEKGLLYPFLMWNCGWRSGGSIEHGHMQLTVAKDLHYPKIEGLRLTANQYEKHYKISYFEDLFRIHESLELGINISNTKVMVILNPFRDKEIWIMNDRLNDDMSACLYTVLAALRDKAGMSNFNVGFLLPPLMPMDKWNDFPVIIRIIDRLSGTELPSDISGMGIFAGADAISDDPYKVIEVIR